MFQLVDMGFSENAATKAAIEAKKANAGAEVRGNQTFWRLTKPFSERDRMDNGSHGRPRPERAARAGRLRPEDQQAPASRGEQSRNRRISYTSVRGQSDLLGNHLQSGIHRASGLYLFF